MKTKLSILQAHMKAGDWTKAISIASKFPRLGEQRGAILDAQLAITNPNFVRGIKRDPHALIEAGKAALMQRYPA